MFSTSAHSLSLHVAPSSWVEKCGAWMLLAAVAMTALLAPPQARAAFSATTTTLTLSASR